jgi:hypothetical protein
MNLFTSAPYVDDTTPNAPGAIVLLDANIEEELGGTEYNPATSYSIGDVVFVEATHRRYEALTASTGQFPPDNLNTDWLDIGATNLWKAFDQGITSQTVADSVDLKFEFQSNTLITSLAFFNIAGSKLILRMAPPGAGDWDDNAPTDDPDYEPPIDFVVQEYELIDTSNRNTWFNWFFLNAAAKTELLINNLPGVAGTTFEVEIVGAPKAAIGEIAAGRMQAVGTTLAGGRIAQEDFSRLDRDFDGNLIIIPRGAADLHDFTVYFPGFDADRVRRIMRSIRAKPTVFVATLDGDQLGFFTYGVLSSFVTTANNRNAYFASVEVRGLV